MPPLQRAVLSALQQRVQSIAERPPAAGIRDHKPELLLSTGIKSKERRAVRNGSRRRDEADEGSVSVNAETCC